MPSDSLRPLSGPGEKEVLQAVEHLLARGFRPELIISSPFLRADRTAELAGSVWPAARRETSAALSDGPAQAIVDLLAPAGPGAVMLVGHQPLLGVVAAFFSGEGPLDFSPAGYARLRLRADGGKAALLEFYSPAAAEGKPR